MDWIRVRIKATRQVIDMLPAPAIAMINGGTAERVASNENAKPEAAVVQPATERAIAPAAAAAPRVSSRARAASTKRK